jgi:DNA-binding MarR family transcriptional regulator
MPARRAEPRPLEDGRQEDWPRAGEAAWLGLMEAHRRVVRALDAELVAGHGLAYRTYELLARLACCGPDRLRMSALAEQAMLSQSRVSRMVDELEREGFVVREGCTDDSRVVYVSITERGRELFGDAQDTFFATVERELFGRLDPEDVEELARIWREVLGDAPDGRADGASRARAPAGRRASRRASGTS